MPRLIAKPKYNPFYFGHALTRRHKCILLLGIIAVSTFSCWWIGITERSPSQPKHHKRTKSEGIFGSPSFRLSHLDYASFWHDVPMKPSTTDPAMIHIITEIPQTVTAKMEVSKQRSHNIIAQDMNKDGSPRYHTYGIPFFNYGLIAQTWEDPNLKSTQGLEGDNDPLDVMELGSSVLKMGSITSCRVLGSLELIDEYEIDHKVLCISINDVHFGQIHTMDDLDRYYPNTLVRLIDWLQRYKTSDGKPENKLDSEIPKSVEDTLKIIDETHERWRALCGHDGTPLSSLHLSASMFWLASPNCRGEGKI